jgi:hypothetical protein
VNALVRLGNDWSAVRVQDDDVTLVVVKMTDTIPTVY